MGVVIGEEEGAILGDYRARQNHRKTVKIAVVSQPDDRAPGLIGRRQMPTWSQDTIRVSVHPDNREYSFT